MAASHPIIVVGAGIGGLTTALALARRGFRVTVVEQAERLEDTGAGIQLSPNATRVLLGLGLEQALKASAVAPQAVEVATARGRPLARVPLGDNAAQRYGAPYWVIHRGDLQAILADAVRGEAGIALELGARFEDCTLHPQGVTVTYSHGRERIEQAGRALIGADGLWSAVRRRLGHSAAPTFRNRTAWRALIPAGDVEPAYSTPMVRLWLGRRAHVVCYPVRGAALINIVAIVEDQSPHPGWSRDGDPAELMQAFAPTVWSDQLRLLIAIPPRWLRWSLYDLTPLDSWGDGPVTLVGDAAHPMLPFLAQGAAMAIEDAAVLAAHFARDLDDPSKAMRGYEAARRRRVARAQHASRRNGGVYHLGGIAAVARDIYLRTANGNRLLHRNDWLYSWRPEPPF